MGLFKKKSKREKGKSPLQLAFEENLKFISQTEFDIDTVRSLFQEGERIHCYTLGECNFPTGRIITADPLCYLQDPKYVFVLEKTVEAKKYPVILSILFSEIAGVRIAGAKLKISDKEVVQYELAEAEEAEKEKHTLSLTGFPVEAGMGCFCDEKAAGDYWNFLKDWYGRYQNGNIYDDYFAELFAKSYGREPKYQREGGDFLLWKNPVGESQIAMFASGMGDGFYPVLWGTDKDGEICELVTLFMNPALF